MVDAFQAVCQGFGFRLADIALVKCDLALQVVQLDRVGIGYGQRADARGGEIGQGGGPIRRSRRPKYARRKVSAALRCRFRPRGCGGCTAAGVRRRCRVRSRS